MLLFIFVCAGLPCTGLLVSTLAFTLLLVLGRVAVLARFGSPRDVEGGLDVDIPDCDSVVFVTSALFVVEVLVVLAATLAPAFFTDCPAVPLTLAVSFFCVALLSGLEEAFLYDSLALPLAACSDTPLFCTVSPLDCMPVLDVSFAGGLELPAPLDFGTLGILPAGGLLCSPRAVVTSGELRFGVTAFCWSVTFVALVWLCETFPPFWLTSPVLFITDALDGRDSADVFDDVPSLGFGALAVPLTGRAGLADFPVSIVGVIGRVDLPASERAPFAVFALSPLEVIDPAVLSVEDMVGLILSVKGIPPLAAEAGGTPVFADVSVVAPLFAVSADFISAVGRIAVGVAALGASVECPFAAVVEAVELSDECAALLLPEDETSLADAEPVAEGLAVAGLSAAAELCGLAETGFAEGILSVVAVPRVLAEAGRADTGLDLSAEAAPCAPVVVGFPTECLSVGAGAAIGGLVADFSDVPAPCVPVVVVAPMPPASLPGVIVGMCDESLCADASAGFTVPGAVWPPETGVGVVVPLLVPLPPLEPMGGRAGAVPPPEAPDEGTGFGVPALLPPLLLASADFPMLPTMFFITIYDSIPGIRLCPNGSPVMAGLSPMRAIIPSTFLPVRAIATTKMHHGTTATPVGTTDIADNKNFKKTTLKTIIRHILANIRTQPLNMSDVLLLPPIANANGDRIVNIATIT